MCPLVKDHWTNPEPAWQLLARPPGASNASFTLSLGACSLRSGYLICVALKIGQQQFVA